MGHKIFTLSLKSAVTRLAVFDGEKLLAKADIAHDPIRLKMFETVMEQEPYRKKAVLEKLKENGIDIKKMDAFAAYGGGLASTESGIYKVNAKMLKDCSGVQPKEHPSVTAAQIIAEFAEENHSPAYLVNTFDVDEFEDAARISGMKGIYRKSHVHALCQKEAARRAAAQLGKRYEACSFIVCHAGRAVSVAAHKHGKMADGSDILNGDGPMAPDQSGCIPLLPVIEMCYCGEYTMLEMMEKVNRDGGLLALLGTDKITEIKERISEGDRWAKLVYESFAYQIAKCIGAYACTLEGKADAVVITGAAAEDADFIENVKKYAGWIAPFLVYGGDFEMEALAAGAERALSGAEQLKEYTGVPVWDGFSFEY